MSIHPPPLMELQEQQGHHSFSSSDLKNDHLWGPHGFTSHHRHHFGVGRLQLLLEQTAFGWDMAHYYQKIPMQFPLVDYKSQLLPSHRWKRQKVATSTASDTIFFVPSLPSKSLRFHFYYDLQLPAKQSTTLFLSLPLQLKITQEGIEHSLAELMTIPLPLLLLPESREEYFSLRDDYFFQSSQEHYAPHKSVVEIEIVNHTARSMHLSHLDLDLSSCALFSNPRTYFTSKGKWEWSGKSFSKNDIFWLEESKAQEMSADCVLVQSSQKRRGPHHED